MLAKGHCTKSEILVSEYKSLCIPVSWVHFQFLVSYWPEYQLWAVVLLIHWLFNSANHTERDLLLWMFQNPFFMVPPFLG